MEASIAEGKSIRESGLYHQAVSGCKILLSGTVTKGLEINLISTEPLIDVPRNSKVGRMSRIWKYGSDFKEIEHWMPWKCF